MSSLYLDKWEKQVSGSAACIVAFVMACAFLVYISVAIARTQAESYLRRGRLYAQKARAFPDSLLVEKSMLYQQGLSFLKQSIRSNPFWAAPYYEYAEIVLEIGAQPSVRKSVDPQALGLSDSQEEAFSEKALRYYRNAVLRDPFCGLYHQRLGDAYARLLDYTAAEKEFASALLTDPDNVSIHLFLARYYEQRHDQEKHQFHLNKVISLYNATLKGGGPLADMVRAYFKSINRQDLI